MSESSILVALFAGIGAIAAAASATRRPFVALGILFFLASISRVTLETPVGTMRLEQPAIAAVALVLLATGRWRRVLQVDRAGLLVAAGFATYGAALAISSALVAPQPVDSLRLVIWLGVSMAGGLVALILAWPDPEASLLPLTIGGALKGAVGIGVASLYLVAGPGIDLGIQEADGIMPRVHAFTWEANLYASFLAMCMPLAIETARRQRRAVGVLLLALVVVALPLGATRGAYLGFGAGLGVYVLVRIVAERRLLDLPRLAAATVSLFVVGLVASSLLLPNVVERVTGVEVLGVVVAAPSSGASESFDPGDPSAPRPSPLPSLEPYPDTVSFRLERVPVALGDLRGSPIIGLGAESFGQRHADPSQVGNPPDHIAILALAALYDAGIVGAVGLGIGFAALLWQLWRRALAAGRLGDTRQVGSAAAFAGSIAAILIAYQATNALHFAINWIIVGSAAALVFSDGTRDAPRPDDIVT